MMVQGYEPQALSFLVADGYDESSILTRKTDVPEIYWLDDEGKKHRYYVDIYLSGEMRMIEVKSLWTLTLQPHKIEAKRAACIQAGFKFEIWVMSKKGERLRVIKYLDDLQEAAVDVVTECAEAEEDVEEMIEASMVADSSLMSQEAVDLHISDSSIVADKILVNYDKMSTTRCRVQVISQGCVIIYYYQSITSSVYDTNAAIVGGLLGAYWGGSRLQTSFLKFMLNKLLSYNYEKHGGRKRPDWLSPRHLPRLAQELFAIAPSALQ